MAKITAATRRKLLRELRAELRYWQGQARMDARWLRGSRAKCKYIGQLMRQVQKGITPQ